MTLGGPKRFLLKNCKKKNYIFRSLLKFEERLIGGGVMVGWCLVAHVILVSVPVQKIEYLGFYTWSGLGSIGNLRLGLGLGLDNLNESSR